MQGGTFHSTLRTGRLVATELDKIYIPHSWRYKQERRCVIWGHGSGGTFQVGPVERAMMAALDTVWLCGTFGGGNSNLRRFGDDASCQNIVDAFTWAKTNLGVKQDKFIFWGGSMGGQTGACVAFYAPTQVKAVGVAIPAIDPEYVRLNDVSGHKAYIETVYGANPVPAAKQIYSRGAAYAALGIPMAMWYATDDVFTPNASYQTFLTAAGSAVVGNSLGAVGHSYAGQSVDVGAAAFLHPHVI